MEKIKIEVLKDGPYYIEADVELVDSDGNVIEHKGKPGKVVLCRCGQSGEKPFCDGTHRRVGWTETKAD